MKLKDLFIAKLFDDELSKEDLRLLVLFPLGFISIVGGLSVAVGIAIIVIRTAVYLSNYGGCQ